MDANKVGSLLPQQFGGILLGKLIGANMNSTDDQRIVMTVSPVPIARTFGSDDIFVTWEVGLQPSQCGKFGNDGIFVELPTSARGCVLTPISRNPAQESWYVTVPLNDA